MKVHSWLKLPFLPRPYAQVMARYHSVTSFRVLLFTHSVTPQGQADAPTQHDALLCYPDTVTRLQIWGMGT